MNTLYSSCKTANDDGQVQSTGLRPFVCNPGCQPRISGDREWRTCSFPADDFFIFLVKLLQVLEVSGVLGKNSTFLQKVDDVFHALLTGELLYLSIESITGDSVQRVLDSVWKDVELRK